MHSQAAYIAAVLARMNTKLRLETDVVTAADAVLAKVENAAVENRTAAEAATTVEGAVAESQTKATQSSAVGTKMCIRCMQQKTLTLFTKPGRKELLKTCSQCLRRKLSPKDSEGLPSPGDDGLLPESAEAYGGLASFSVLPQNPHVYEKPRLHMPKRSDRSKTRRSSTPTRAPDSQV